MNVGGISQYTNILTEMNALNSDITETTNFEAKLKQAMNSSEQAELKEACEEMESYMLSMIYKQMRNSITINEADSFLPKGDYEKMFEDFMVDNQVENMIDAGGVGLSNYMYRQLSTQTLPADRKSVV